MFECRHQPLKLPDALAAELVAAYSQPHRAYHNLDHITALLGWFDRVTDDIGWRAPADVYTAIVFHDAIYVPAAKDNEERSAAWAELACKAGVAADGPRVAELIRLTAGHGANQTTDPDAALFLDCDLAVVGAPADQFASYDAAIAVEYGHLPREAYAAGRAKFLSALLAKPRIFLTDYFHDLLDAQARANLSAALETMPG